MNHRFVTRTILLALASAGVLIAVLVVAGRFYLPHMVAAKLAKVMQVGVKIDDIALSSNTIDITKLEVSNPPRSTLRHALVAQEIRLATPWRHYFDNPIVIEQIDVNDIYLGLEFASTQAKTGNWTAIVGHMSPEHKTAKGKSVFIKKLVLNNLQIELLFRQGGKGPQTLKPIPQLVFYNISSDKGVPTEEISRIIINHMLQQVFSLDNIPNMLENVLQMPAEGIETLLLPFQKLFKHDKTSQD